MTVRDFINHVASRFSSLPDGFRFIDYKEGDIYDGEYLSNVPQYLLDKIVVMTYNDTENNIFNLVVD